jgi:hypothetical protein
MRPAESTAEKMTGMARLGRFERPTSGSGVVKVNFVSRGLSCPYKMP